MRVKELNLEYKKNPMGVNTKTPIFGWKVEFVSGDNTCWLQSAYQILVSDNQDELLENRGNMWDSGRCEEGRMTDIPYGGRPLLSEQRYYWKVRVWDQHGNPSEFSRETWFEMGILEPDRWKADWIGEEQDFVTHIYRKKFYLKKSIQRASIHICGLGHYELLVNNQAPTDAVLTPGWTNYEKTCFYNTYDITKFLREGENALGVYLGDGMFHVKKKRYVYYERSYGHMKLMFQIHVCYTDGTVEELYSDKEMKMAESPLVYSGIYGGEDYDARMEQTGFSSWDFRENDSWKPVSIVKAPGGVLREEPAEPLKIQKSYEPVRIEETSPGVWLYDFGKNFSGWISMGIQGGKKTKGKQILIKPGEILTKEQTPDQRVTGEGYCWKYICSQKEIQEYRPKFSYTGFRYVQVEGAVPKGAHQDSGEMPVILWMKGEFIYGDVDNPGQFCCSNPLFNQIHDLINQAVQSNMKSILTDCPHREKLGWLEQSHLIGPAIMCGYDIRSLYGKIQQDMADSQHEDGLIPDICPEYVKGFEKWHQGFLDSPEWGSAVIINPWYLYLCYEDSSLIRKYYPVMKKYLNYLSQKTHHHILHHGLGDWLDMGPNAPHSQNTPVPVIATAIFYYDLDIMRKSALLLSMEEDAKEYESAMEAVKREFNLQFYDGQTGRYATGSQAAQAMALMTGLVEEGQEDRVLSYLVQDIERRNHATTAGDVGHPFVMAALTKYGQSAVIEKMTSVTDAPGYGYQVKCGATTLTEEWDGPEPGHPHGSQNHLMLGSVQEWFYCGLAGLPGVRQREGQEELVLAPYFSKEISFVKASAFHPYGNLSIEWKRIGDRLEVTAEIPPNKKGILLFQKERMEFYGKAKFVLKEQEEMDRE